MAQPKPKATKRAHSSAELLDAAREAAIASYSPYSKFRVGAAVSSGGRIYYGTNIENASYGLTICAERVAIFNAISDGNRSIDALAVTCVDVARDAPVNLRMPCGACRQVISEFAAPSTPVFIDGCRETTVAELLPLPFRLD
jgi:cytidine deaminase